MAVRLVRFCEYAKFISLSVLGVSLFFLIGVSNSHATSKKCLDRKVKPSVIFNHEDISTTLNHNLTSSQITRVASSSGISRIHKFVKLRGLAHTSIASGYQVEVGMLEMKHGVTCVWLSKVKMTFDTRKSEIYVERNYRKGSCEYNAVLSHEKEHMGINARVKRKYEDIIRDRLIRWANNMRPVQVSSSTNGARLMTQRVSGDMQPVIDEFYRVRKRENNKIDTDVSYRRVHKRCTNW